MKFVTVTLNPALDMNITLSVPLVTDGLNRSESAAFSPGGKGINVSRALHAFGYDSDCICVLGGFTGAKVKAMLKEEGVNVRAVATTADTRLNISVLSQGSQCEINNPPMRPKEADAPASQDGGIRPTNETADILDKVNRMICRIIEQNAGEQTAVILAGSIPPDMPQNTYATIVRTVHSMGALAVCDCDGEALRSVLPACPDYIKPNLDELSALTERRLTREQIPSAASEISITTNGRTAVIATAGSSGAYLARGHESFYAPSSHVERVRTLKGAGDTFLAAYLLARYDRELTEVQSLKFAANAAARKIATPGGDYPDLRE